MIKNKQNQLILYITSIFIVLLLIVFLFFKLFPKTQDNKNVTFHISNISYGNKKASILLKLNGSVIVESQDINKEKDPLLSLKDGFYTIEVSDLTNNFKVKKDFQIVNGQRKYIYISFSKLFYNEFLPVYKQEYFKRYVKNKRFTPEEKKEIWKQIDQKLTGNFLKMRGYVEEKPFFSIKIFDEAPQIN